MVIIASTARIDHLTVDHDLANDQPNAATFGSARSGVRRDSLEVSLNISNLLIFRILPVDIN
jgi:hypothetical protein